MRPLDYSLINELRGSPEIKFFSIIPSVICNSIEVLDSPSRN
jgi:hypothetical protein